MIKGKPWNVLVRSTGTYDVYADQYPVNEGHLLYVPRVDARRDVIKCLEAAYQYGSNKVQAGKWEGFNVGMNQGVCAGQSIEWSHVHLIPRFKGDCLNPQGGVRGVIPSKQQYHHDQMKIIRDKLKEQITDQDTFYISSKDGYELLKEKVQEELQELNASDWKDPEEYADVIEVLIALAKKNDITEIDINDERVRKYNEKGGFDDYLAMNI